MSSPVFLSDIIMADILTSCARMFSDIYLVACSVATAFYFQGDDASPANAGSDVDKLASAVRTALKKTTCKDAGAIGVLLVAAPYAFRLRQCVNEYLKASSGSSDAKRHAANAVKYASAFPMICLSAAQKKITASRASDGYADWALNAAFGMWIVSVAFNSLYSFYWDIAFDWDLSHFADGWKLSDLVSPTQRSASENSTGDYIDAPKDDSGDKAHALASSDALERQDADQLASVSPGSGKPHDFPALLRPNLCFSSSKFYYSAIVVDFFLRIVWTLKLSSYIQIDMLAYSGFWLNVLEIYRRWQWTFLRIEKEAATAPI
ncbi:protein-ER retention protein [Coemansia sp. RSA 1933]|nr:protein-ER retention protein [Coemansia sp. RSA 1933]